MFKQRIYEIIEVAAPNDKLSRQYDIFLLSLISLNILVVIISTVESFFMKYEVCLNLFEVFSITIFSIEYILRLWTANFKKEYTNPITGRLRFALTPMLIIDLVAILPFFLPMFLGADLRLLRALRLLRLFRLFKMARYITALTLFNNVFRKKKEELMLSFFFVLILLIVSASLMYFAENSVQPDVFSSIPATMWWAVATLTTVGYGGKGTNV